MGEKFWMVKGSIGSPVVQFHSEEAARIRATQIAVESGKPTFVLEAVRVFVPSEPVVISVTEREL